MEDLLTLGQSLLHYVITDKIGRGGMGEVYKGFDQKLNRTVAIKVMHLSEGADLDEGKRRFLSEAQILAKLNHSNFTTIYEIEESDSLSFFVMEYLEGETLKDIAVKEDFTFGKVFEIFKTVAKSVSALHQEGIFHRDLKPSNIFITNKGDVKILDLGIAKWDDDPNGKKTGLYQIVGSLIYCAPEIIEFKKFNTATEIYCLTLSLINTIQGFPLFDGNSSEEIISSVRYEEANFPEEMDRNLPIPVRDFLMKGVEKDPRDRISTLDEFLLILNAICDGVSKQFLELPIYKIHDESLVLAHGGMKKEIKKDNNIYTMTLNNGDLKVNPKEQKRATQRKREKTKGKVKNNGKVVKRKKSLIPLPYVIAVSLAIFFVYRINKHPNVAENTNVVDTHIKKVDGPKPAAKELVTHQDLHDIQLLVERDDNKLIMGQVKEADKLLNRATELKIKIPYMIKLGFKRLVENYNKGKENKVSRGLFYANRILKKKIEEKEQLLKERLPSSEK